MTNWTVPRCPTWCSGNHEAILTPAEDPTELDATGSLIAHSRVLATTPDGLAVELIVYEPHPDHGPASAPGVAVFLPELHGVELVTTETLRTWAQALTDAADLTDRLSQGEPTP